MAKTVTVRFKLDEEIKEGLEQVCSEAGISVSDAIIMFVEKVVREKRIPFEIKLDPFYSESNIKYLEKKMQDIKDGKVRFVEHELIEVE